jgi:hypothetical protein
VDAVVPRDAELAGERVVVADVRQHPRVARLALP